MTVTVEAAEAYWREALTSGGVSDLPRWTGRAPTPGSAARTVPLARDLTPALLGVAAEIGAPIEAVLVAVHAKVLATLCGEADVVIGYRHAPAEPVLPLRVRTGGRSWRDLLSAAAGALAELSEHRNYPVAELRSALGVPGPVFTTVVQATAGATSDVPLTVTLDSGGLVLRYRTEHLDGAAAERIAGYHLAALAALTALPDAEHSRSCLLSAAELDLQLHGMAGPRVDLPDLRFHELFEQQVRTAPDAVAVEHGTQAWTYRELNARANATARALLARGLVAEDVVAVVTERNPDWLAAVLAIGKAGGAYLPIEPHFPADRIAATLNRAAARFALTEPASTANLTAALAEVAEVVVADVAATWTEGHGSEDLGIAVAADQLAYIYFTSGSTGAPKGAMCEHAGMVNHLFAKIADLGIGADCVVAQTAPQCFDISLWQLVSALMVGGRTRIVEQDDILDVARFVDLLDAASVDVVQLVPSYLDAVLAHLEAHPRELPALRCVSVTGEAVKKELTQRWFAVKPGIKLVNAYGLTETCDDTNHEVMDRVPEPDRVPLGPPIHNVIVGVVDSHLVPVPLGAPGEIVFSGVCVGRGYVNDPDRTAAAFLSDPHRPGQRLYRSGDHGRWRPDGKLEFLGRRDSQVKVAGFRIEIGEVENRLLQISGIADGAVVVAGTGDATKHLVAFYSGPAVLDVARIREHLGRALPSYMVPRAFHWRDRLPLTANGKIDRKALAEAANEVAETGVRDALTTPAERRVAQAWAAVLELPMDRIGPGDSFFDSGGTSLSAVKLVIALGRQTSLKEVVAHPVLRELAHLLDQRSIPAQPSQRVATAVDAAAPAPERDWEN